MLNLYKAEIESKLKELEEHKIYKEINTIEKLQFFMERHAFAVFDFMSLLKSLQNAIAPSNPIWFPPKNNSLAHFINEIVLCEESDIDLSGGTISHFELYLESMNEVRANSDIVMAWLREFEFTGKLENKVIIPNSALTFMEHTFSQVNSGKLNEIASSFCFGREKLIPIMFQTLLDKMNINKDMAPKFHYYLERHIEVDGDNHGPLAEKMLDIFCNGDDFKWEESKNAAISALNSRIKFWDDILVEMDKIDVI